MAEESNSERLHKEKIRQALLRRSPDEIRHIANEQHRMGNFHEAWACYNTAIHLAEGDDCESFRNKALLAYETFVDQDTGKPKDAASRESLQALYEAWESAKIACALSTLSTSDRILYGKICVAIGVTACLPRYMSNALGLEMARCRHRETLIALIHVYQALLQIGGAVLVTLPRGSALTSLVF
eukprot:gb/GECG01010289.1/.p1 GENE.gb/GECG01010289.1/~~gb/GECG01010289.1/.p1  ORF type:complete len:184 (+),score=11.56 gb/GECG01010289.1/:1-552(+)